MEKMILGLLMLKRLTIYEIRGLISQNFKAMCSDSLGGLQAAMKRLFDAGKVTYEDILEKGVHKKRFAITDAGRVEFREWLLKPAAIAHPKNIEIGKLLFMGFAPRQERKALIGGAIELLKQELSYLMVIQDSIEQISAEDMVSEAASHFTNDAEYREGLIKTTENENFNQLLFDCYFYQGVALEYGIDAMKFQIEWLEKLSQKTENAGAFANRRGDY